MKLVLQEYASKNHTLLYRLLFCVVGSELFVEVFKKVRYSYISPFCSFKSGHWNTNGKFANWGDASEIIEGYKIYMY